MYRGCKQQIYYRKNTLSKNIFNINLTTLIEEVNFQRKSKLKDDDI